MLDADLSGDRVRGGQVVTGEHPHVDAERLQLRDRLGGFGFDGVGDRQHRGQFPVDSDEHRCAPGRGLGRDDGFQRADGHTTGSHQRGVADQHVPVADDRVDAVTGHGVEGPHRRQSEGTRGRGCDDRLADGVLTAGLGGGNHCQHLVLGPVAGGDDAGQCGPAAGDGAGLVQHDSGDPASCLQGVAVADKDPQLGGAAGADHDRGRGGQPQRARAGDDQHGDGGGDRHGQAAGVRAEQRPGDEGGRGQSQHERDEPGRDPVGQALQRHLGALRVLDQPHDLGQCGVRADRGRPQDDAAGAVDGGADDGVADRLVHRQALAGQHALVDRGRAVGDDTVDRDLLTGADAHQVADHDAARPGCRSRRRRGARGRSSAPGRPGR